MHTVGPAELRDVTAAVFSAAGVPGDDARTVAESLVEANLRGHDSHGVMRVAEYVRQLRGGELVATAELDILRETPSLIIADANLGFGQVQCARLIDRLLPKAAAQGVACGTMRNCGHVGRLGEWAERIAAQGLAGFVTVNDNGVLRCVAPPGGVEPVISTNPLAIGLPTGGDPLVLDMSTSMAANGKIRVHHSAGQPCPPGWLQDAQGRPTTDPAARFTDPPGTILPLGGADSFKGFGLGLLLDVLVGGLSGGHCPPAADGEPSTNNVLMVLWEPQQASGREHFLAEADKLIAFVRNSRRKPGVEEIAVPGDRSARMRRERSRNGIPLDDGCWSQLRTLAEEFHVPLPATAEES